MRPNLIGSAIEIDTVRYAGKQIIERLEAIDILPGIIATRTSPAFQHRITPERLRSNRTVPEVLSNGVRNISPMAKVTLW
jgi:hypothetical protein